MKNLNKSHFFIFILLTVLIFTVIGTNHRNGNSMLEKPIKVKMSAYWDLTGTPIDIDDSDMAKNWSYTALNYDWCSGSGTWSDPYLIKNVYINGLNTTSCIRIRNSQAYFEIRNCTLTNAADGDFGTMFAGIHLLGTSNGRIHNNTCSFNNQAGIIVERSINNTIWDCIANNNKDYGIALYWDSGIGSDNNTVKDCTTNNNMYYGIHVYASNYARIIHNTINNSYYNGIDIQGITHNHTIIGNTISFAEDNGISLGNIYDCKIINNRITNCDQSGVQCYSCSNSLFSDNNISEIYWSGLSVSDGKNNIIIHNFIEKSYFGIYSYSLNYSSVLYNILQDLDNRGISIEDFYHSNISMNNISNCVNSGIDIFLCNNVSVSENNLNNNKDGLEVTFSQKINITNNEIERNSEVGIAVTHSNFTKISNNNINYNQIGILIDFCSDTYIANNYLYCNSICISELNCYRTVRENNTCVECPSEGIPGFNLLFLIGVITIFSIILIKKKTMIRHQN